jgi:hypothetical protein
MQFHYLSYTITESMPVYGGSNGPELTPLKAIDKSDFCTVCHSCESRNPRDKLQQEFMTPFPDQVEDKDFHGFPPTR